MHWCHWTSVQIFHLQCISSWVYKVVPWWSYCSFQLLPSYCSWRLKHRYVYIHLIVTTKWVYFSPEFFLPNYTCAIQSNLCWNWSPLAGHTPSPGAENLLMPQGVNGIQLMKAAVARNSQYRFTATFSNANLGYVIGSVNSTTGDVANLCFWELSFRPYLATQFTVSPIVTITLVLMLWCSGDTGSSLHHNLYHPGYLHKAMHAQCTNNTL